MNTKLLLAMAVVLLITSIDGRSQTAKEAIPLKIDNISIEDGLSHIGVTCFCSDEKGFVWIGTYDGLNRYDGSNFVTYYHHPDDSTSLIHNRVSDILNIDSEYLLVGTERGLTIFNKKSESFQFLQADQTSELNSVRINRLYKDRAGRIWILTGNGLVYVLNDQMQEIKKISFNDLMPRGSLQDICQIGSDQFIISTTSSLIAVTSTFQFYEVSKIDRHGAAMRKLVKTDHDHLLVATDQGVFNWTFKIDESTKFVRLEQQDNLLPEVECISMMKGLQDGIWVGSKSNGAFLLTSNENNYTIQNFTNDADAPGGLSSNWITALHEDRIGGIWLGTSEQGVDRFNVDRSVFQTYGVESDQPYGIKNDYIISSAVLQNGLVLIGNRKKGISFFDPLTNQFVASFFNDKPIRHKTILSVYEDRKGVIWISGGGKLFRLFPGQKNLEVMNNRDLIGARDLNIYSFCEDDDGFLWIGARQGLFRLDVDINNNVASVLSFNGSDNESHPLDKKVISTIYNDPINNNLWIGTWHNGLYRMNTSGEEVHAADFQVQNFRFTPDDQASLREDFVSCILRSTNKQLWIGTEGGGISRYVSDADGFIHYSVDDGLSNHVVKNIQEDRQGRLWISTNNKLDLFNPGITEFKSFSVNDGLQSNYFTKAASRLGDGRMLLGGNGGVSVFNPDRIGENNYLAVPEFGRFQLSYKAIHPNEKVDGHILLPRSLSHTSTIELEHHQNVFSIEMLGIHFDDSDDLIFKYRLKGYDKDWLMASTDNRLAAYTNVPHGKYTFEFSVANGFNEWSPEVKTIDIIIHPPFWLSIWAYILYVVAVIIILFIVFAVLINIERLKHNVKLEQFEQQKKQEVHDVKLKFFTNISHEFRTPVALILGPVETLLNQFANNDNVRHNLLLIRKQGNYLLKLLDQLLEFRKAESEALELKCHRSDIVDHVKLIYKGFEGQAGRKNITYRFHQSGSIDMWFDPNKVEKIIYNLISNALKYTPQGGKVEVSVRINENQKMEVKVSDNGPGLEPEEAQHVFDRFYRSESTAESGTGIGLALAKSLAKLHQGELDVSSTKGEGSTFCLTLQKTDDYLAEDQKVMTHPLVYRTTNHEEVGSLSDQSRTIETPEIEGGKTILLVEDHCEMREFLKDTLSQHYKVEVADNGRAAFAKACEKMPDIIISDVMMPVMTGIELLEQIKKETMTCHIPVILLTAKNEIADKFEGLEMGADDYIAKPFHIDHLLIRINNLLANRERLHQRYRAGLSLEDTEAEVPESSRDADFINALHLITDQNMQDVDFSTDELCKAMFISRTGFYKKLKALTGQTPGEFLKLYRTKKAGELLKTGEFSVSEVIGQVGFKSRSHFYKCFKDMFGVLPADYIKKEESLKD